MADETHEFDAEIFSTGTWNGDNYTKADLDNMVANFQALSGTVKPPIKLGHNEQQMKDGNPALGWITKLSRVGNKLVATISQVPDLLFRAIKAGRYKRVSSEVYWNYKQDGNIYKRVLAAVAFLGADIPAVSDLADLEALLTQDNLRDSFESMMLYSFNVGDDGIIEPQAVQTDREKIMEFDMEQKLGAVQKQLDELQKNYMSMEKENESLKADLATRETAEADAKKEMSLKSFTDTINKAVEGFKLPPAARDLLLQPEKRVYSADTGVSVTIETLEEVFKLFDKIVPIDEKGIDTKPIVKDDFDDHGTAVDAAAREYAAEHKVSYGEAVAAVLKTNLDLAGDYIKETITTKEADDD